MLRQSKVGEWSDMKLIPIIHKLIKLFTLKRSRFDSNFTLKHSRLSAETLLHTIYTYIYLYKKTCSYSQQIVNNFFVKNILTILTMVLITFGVTACTSQAEIFQDSALHLTNPPHNCFRQILGNKYHPDQFYTCDKSRSVFCSTSLKRKCSMRIPSSNIYGDYHHE